MHFLYLPELPTTGVPRHALDKVESLADPSEGNPKIVHFSIILCCLETVSTKRTQQQCDEKVENLKAVEIIKKIKRLESSIQKSEF